MNTNTMHKRTELPISDPGMESKEGSEWRRPSNPSQSHLQPQAISKPKFLPFLTKKSTRTPRIPAQLSDNSKPTPRFAQVVDPQKEDARPQLQPQNAPILHLPLDIWHLITSQLHQSSINALILTHPSLHNLLTPILYHTIDLSLASPSTNTPYTTALTASHRSHIAKSQYLFISQILTHHSLALYVRSLKWTMGLERMGLLPQKIRDIEPVWKDEDLFRVFEMLKGVIRLHLTGTRSHGHWPRDKLGIGLFPNAREVKLSGTMRRSFVDAVLFTYPLKVKVKKRYKGEKEKVQLKRLDLEDLQEESRPLLGSWNARGMDGRMARGVEEQGFEERLRICEPMQKVLTEELHGRCKNLQRLSIRFYGMSERGSSDDGLWAEWADFIRWVKPKEMVFDCDRKLKRHGNGGSALNVARLREQRGRAAVANDRRFGETLLPVLKDGWDGLKRVEIRGVSESVVKELRELEKIGVKVLLDVDENIEEDG